MKKYVQAKKKRLNSYLEKKLLKYQEDFSGFNHWGNDSFSRIPEFISRGKMIRGGLVYLGYEAFRGEDLSEADPLAAAVELLHAGFLIHDDIMDRDELRRGKPAIHVSLRDRFDCSFKDIAKTAENVAICLGNICYFTAFDLIDDSNITKLFNREAIVTGLGQMEDLYQSSSDNNPGYETILNIYRLKTARYTFSLPLKTGAIAGGADPESLEMLNDLGIEVGTLFQMRDDELNFFGDEEVTGKPAGSDIREGKKTLIYSLLMDKADKNDSAFIKQCIGKKDLEKNDVLKLRTICDKCGASQIHEQMALKFHNNAVAIIEKLKINEHAKKVINDILNYSYKRGY
jgi:geranylgeranyl diphosphate synthase type I